MQSKITILTLCCTFATFILNANAQVDNASGESSVVRAAIASPVTRSPEARSAAELLPYPKSVKPADFVLAADGSLFGQLLSRSGKPLRQSIVTLDHPHGTLASTSTDDLGRFVFRNAPQGAVVVNVDGKALRGIRIWNQAKAPPRANERLLLTVGPVVRGQHLGNVVYGSSGGGHFGGLFDRILRNPWLVGIGTAAAITIPLATADQDAGINSQVARTPSTDATTDTGTDAGTDTGSGEPETGRTNLHTVLIDRSDAS